MKNGMHCLMSGTLDDLRLFAAVVQAGSFSGAARRLGVPKQTLSRRIAELEDRLRVQLLHRTTRSLKPTEIGAAYAARAGEIVRLAEEAERAVTDSRPEPSGLLRVTADPVFGEAFVSGLVVEYARRFAGVEVEVVLTRRRVDLIEEGFDVAFRIGMVDDPSLTAIRLGPARVRYCASPAYVKRHGRPALPKDLARHQCLVVNEGTPVRWPFRGTKGIDLVPIQGRLRMTSFAMAHEAALAGLGIAIFPEFACAEDLRKKKLVSVLDDFVVEVGGIFLVHPAARYLSARVRSFVDLTTTRLARRRR
jgi:DNA-binding transcriptional LysR family regulator